MLCKSQTTQCVKVQIDAYGLIDSGADITITGALFKKVVTVA